MASGVPYHTAWGTMAHPECCTATTLLIGQRLRLPVLGHGMRERARVLAVRVACVVSGVRVCVHACVRACVFSGRTGGAPRRSDENLPLSCSQSCSRNRSHRPCSPSRTCSAATHPCTTDAAQIARVSAQIWAGAGKGVGVILLQQRMWASHGSHVGQSHRALDPIVSIWLAGH